MKFSEKLNNKKELFFLAVSPVGRVQQSINEVKAAISQKYDTKGAFRSPGHITLQMPFLHKETKMAAITEALTNFCGQYEPFPVVLNGFGAFKPRVVYIKVEENELLNQLQHNLKKLLKSFQIFNSTHKSGGFNPHITVAFRDLAKHQFYKLWSDYETKPYEETFTTEGISLYKHDGKQWQEHLFFPFSSM